MEMTQRYVQEIKEGDMLKALRKEYSIDLMSDIVCRKRKPSGSGGEILADELDKMVREVIKGVELLPTKANPVVARKIAERVMIKLDIDMIPLVYGYCCAFKNNQTGPFVGQCVESEKSEIGPSIARATVERCSACREHFYTDEHFKPWWENMASEYRTCLEGGLLSKPLQDEAKKLSNP